MTIGDALKAGVKVLQESGTPEPIASARTLLQRLLNKSWTELFRDANLELPTEQYEQYQQMLERRMKHEPVNYIVGWTHFGGVKLAVTPATLSPRFETEILVNDVLAYLNTDLERFAAVYDIGTGSGAIALAIAQALKTADFEFHVTGTDISEEALAIAKQNSVDNGLEEKVSFIKTSLLPDIVHVSPVIVANLPYIPSERMSQLETQVRGYEPHLALDGGPDGLDLYRQLFEQITTQRITPRAIFCEIDETQGKSITDLIHNHWPEAKVIIKHDFAGHDRFIHVLFS